MTNQSLRDENSEQFCSKAIKELFWCKQLWP